jgi:adenosine deaminase
MRRRALALARALPKTELHLHLDGSLSAGFIARRAVARGIDLPCRPERVRHYLHGCKAALRAASDGAAPQLEHQNWGVFDFCNQFLMAAAELREASADVALRAAADNVRICELRFCPALHCREGLSERAAVHAVCDGLEDARRAEPRLGAVGAILCALRSKSSAHGVATVELAHACADRGVVGVDVAGDEGSWPLRRHLPMLVRAEELGVPMTLHAGEWPHPRFTSILENLELALECGARRIGHGVALAHPEAAALRARAAASGTLVEVCMTSNVGSGRVGSFAEHPVRTLLDAGVRCALSSDNLLLSGDAHLVAGATLELARFVDLVGCSEAEVKEVLLAGARASFCPGAAAVAVEMEADIDRVLASANDDGSPAHGLLRTVY